MDRIKMANVIFEYIEVFHNYQQRHSSLGMYNPNETEPLNLQDYPVA